MHEWWAEDHTGGEVADQKPEVRLCFPELIGTTYYAVKRPYRPSFANATASVGTVEVRSNGNRWSASASASVPAAWGSSLRAEISPRACSIRRHGRRQAQEALDTIEGKPPKRALRSVED
jgi:hypothetical protein